MSHLDEPECRACKRCGKVLPWTREHFVWRNDRQALVRRCRACQRTRYNEWADPRKAELATRAAARQRAKRSESAKRPPGSSCELCGNAFTGEGRSKPHYDHEHTSGAFRGWVCGWCNVALGMLGDNPEIADRAAAYLRKRGCRRWRLACP